MLSRQPATFYIRKPLIFDLLNFVFRITAQKIYNRHSIKIRWWLFFLLLSPSVLTPAFSFWEPESISPVYVKKKSHKNPHAIIRFLCKWVSIFWLGSIQGAEVAFDVFVFDSTWEGKEGGKSHPLWVWKIRCKNMAYTYVCVLQVQGWKIVNLVIHLLGRWIWGLQEDYNGISYFFLGHKRQNWVLAQHNLSTVLCLPKHVGMAEKRWHCYSPFCLELFGSVLKVHLAVEMGRTHRHYLATSLPHPFLFCLLPLMQWVFL